MLAIMRHTLYKSGFLLVEPLYSGGSSAGQMDQSTMQAKSFISQNAQVHVTSKKGSKSSSLCEKLVTLYATIFEQLGANP